MEAAAILQIVNLLAKVTVGMLTAVELNQTERLPALRLHAENIEKMIAAGREPTQGEIDTLAGAILSDIDFIKQRAADARA